MYVPELKETKVEPLPSASIETLKGLREEMCSQSASRDFKLQSHQRFLRRILSPDAPTRSLLMVHGTGSGKTCSAIQIAEEYIIRPEFQDSKVLVVCQPSVQRNFRKQIFDDSKVHIDDDGFILSKQCTGRRYLEMLQRIQKEPLKWSSRKVREQMIGVVKKIIDEFYEFKGYIQLFNDLEEQQKLGNEEHINKWIHKTYDNRMIIIDEAHNLKDSSDSSTSKLVSMALERIVKIARNVTLILLTATPMYDSYSEIIFYFNLFLWNDKKQSSQKQIAPSKVFTKSGEFQEGMEDQFRSWCQDYISYVKGDNPLTFPFRLPPPESLIAPISTKDYLGNIIPTKQKRNILTLTGSILNGQQLKVVQQLKPLGRNPPTELICVLPDNKPLTSIFVTKEEGYDYAPNIPKFLSPSQISNYSSKFALTLKIIENSKGLIFVYTNSVEIGANLFAMALEEHGYTNADNRTFLINTSNEIPRNTKGKFVIFSGGSTSVSDIDKMLSRIKRRENMNGDDVKIIIGTKRVAEGIDFSFIRQVHVLDYWWNMSRIEQVVGRGIRTCSHQLLPFEKQNCTVYLHCCVYPDADRETLDEYYYRIMVEGKAKEISKIKRIIMESAMDCPLQYEINNLPPSWKDLEITQERSQDSKQVTLTLNQLSSPIFVEFGDLVCKIKEKEVDPLHERPLSSYLDVRDEIFDKLITMFLNKPVWIKNDLMKSEELSSYDPNVVIYLLHNAIDTGLILKNKYGQKGFLESRKNYYVFNMTDSDVVQDLLIDTHKETLVPFPKVFKEVKMKSIDISKIPGEFSDEIKTWYVVDHVLTKNERIDHMINLDWDNPPIYAKILKLDDIHILGSNNFYKGNKKVILLGEDQDLYMKWLESRKQIYISLKNVITATMKNGLLFNLDEKEHDTLKISERFKTFGGRNCNTFHKSLVNKFAEWLDGRGFPKPLTKPEQCQYLSLLIREAVIKGKKGIAWLTPEEFEIFNEDINRKDLIERLYK